MTAVAIQPITRRYEGNVNSPINLRFDAKRIVTTISGTDTTPLITADQNSARIGFSPTKFNNNPTSVARASTP